MKQIKTIAKTYEKNIGSRSLTNHNQGDYLEEISESGGRLNLGWSDLLARLLCRSMPPNSWEKYKPFFFFFEEKISNRNHYTCMMMLPNQCNLRLVLGEKYPNKADAKKNATFRCCQKLIRMGYFDKYLVPKSLNKDQVEFITLQIDPLANHFDSKKAIDDSNPHNFSHFAKRFQLVEKAQARTFKGYLHKITLEKRNCSEFNICFVHSSKLPELKNSEFTIQYVEMIEFTVEKYQEYMLIHRYLICFVESKLLHFLGILTDEPSNYLNFEQQVLDEEYQSWISHKPSISFFVIANENLAVNETFNRILKEYITYQSRVYQYTNSLSYDADLGQNSSLWALPRNTFSCDMDPENSSRIHENVIQDFWSFSKYEFLEIQNLEDVDYVSSSDGKMSLQSRVIFYIDPLLKEKELDDDYTFGLKVKNIEDDQIVKIFIDAELMVSPVSLKLYNDLEAVIKGFKNLDQAELSLTLYQQMIDEEKIEVGGAYDEGRLSLELNPERLLNTLGDFEKQIYKQTNLLSEYIAPARNIENNQEIFFTEQADDHEKMRKNLKEIFTIEKSPEETVRNYAILGSRLIEALLAIEVFFKNTEEWDYSLERIKKHQIQQWKDQNDFTSISELFVSERGNHLLCNAIIEEADRQRFRSCAEYLTQTRLSEILKVTSYMLYDKERRNFQKAREYLNKCGLLEHKRVEVERIKEKKNSSGGMNVVSLLYSQKFNKLEEVLGYKFQDKCLLTSAFMEISFRDYFVEWIEKQSGFSQRNK